MESELHGGELEEGGEGCAHYPKGVPVMFREKVLFQRVTVLVSMLLFALSSFVGLCACSSAETAEYASIALDENTFEDEALRTYLSRHFDDNQNGVLDGGEAERIRELGCYELYTEGDPEYDRAREFPALFSLKGLELLPELSALRLSVENLTSIELPFMERLPLWSSTERTIQRGSILIRSMFPIARCFRLLFWIQPAFRLWI